jgi:hypothetical protein
MVLKEEKSSFFIVKYKCMGSLVFSHIIDIKWSLLYNDSEILCNWG